MRLAIQLPLLRVPTSRLGIAFSAHPATLFGTETASDGRRVVHLAASLRDRPIERDMLVEVVSFDEIEGATRESHLVLRGDASHHPELFPHLEAQLDAVPIGRHSTALFFIGTYTPPLGPVGAAADAIALHRFAEESVRGMFGTAADRLISE